jgi:hypothetical protein
MRIGNSAVKAQTEAPKSHLVSWNQAAYSGVWNRQQVQGPWQVVSQWHRQLQSQCHCLTFFSSWTFATIRRWYFLEVFQRLLENKTALCSNKSLLLGGQACDLTQGEQEPRLDEAGLIFAEAPLLLDEQRFPHSEA